MTPRPSATIVLLRDAPGGLEVFMVRRQESVAFMGGAWVFPGGGVDPADFDANQDWCDGTERAAGQLPPLPAREAVAHHVAGLRELFEEAGVLIARRRGTDVAPTDVARPFQGRPEAYQLRVLADARQFRVVIQEEGLRLALDQLVPCAHWVTPAHEPRRFDTRFFATRMPDGQVATHDNHEHVASRWIAPGDAVRQAVAAEIVLPPPTWTMLSELEGFASVDAALASFAGRPIERREPVLEEIGGRKVITIPGLTARFQRVDRGWQLVQYPKPEA